MTNVLSFIPTDSHVCTTLGTNSDRTASGHDTSHGTESNKIIRHFIKELFNRNFKHDYIWTQHPMTSKKRPKHESVNVFLRPLARFETDLWSRYPFNDSLNQSPSQNIITKKNNIRQNAETRWHISNLTWALQNRSRWDRYQGARP